LSWQNHKKDKHVRHFILAILTAICLGGPAVHAASLPPIRQVVSFGDSLSDCGAYGYKPTTAPALTWNQLVARHFHDDLQPNWVGKNPAIANTDVQEHSPGGLCSAQGGARTATGIPGQPESPPISGVVQLDHFLAQHSRFSDDQLVTVYLGANDVLINFFTLNGELSKGNAAAAPATKAVIEQAARDAAGLVQRILDHGAKRVAVLNLYDLGGSSFIAASPVLSGLVDDFNATLRNALPQDPRVLPVDAHAFFAGLAADPAAHGFRHPMNEDACQIPTKLGPDCYISPSKWKSPDADQTYMLIGMVHFTARTEELLAEYVLGRIEGH
jgi:phospholipase/lecithinase/hemolysin